MLRGNGAGLDVLTTAKMLAASGYFKDVRDQAQAVAKVLAGMEMGFGAVASVMGVHFFEGKPVIGANLIAAAIKGSRKYDYRIKEHSDQGCTLVILQDGKEVGESSFVRADAERAGLLNKQNWKGYPKAMYFARAISQAGRWYCPDIFGGVTVYTGEELGADDTDQQGTPRTVIDGEARDVTALHAADDALVPDQIFPMPTADPEPATPAALVCADCGRIIRQQGFADGTIWTPLYIAERGRANHGRPLCYKHLKEAAKQATEPVPAVAEEVAF
jgi:hypothetical protein